MSLFFLFKILIIEIKVLNLNTFNQQDEEKYFKIIPLDKIHHTL